MQDVVRLTIPAKPDYVGIARLTVSGIANRLGFSYEEIEDIKLSVAEAVTNATLHAYEDDNGEIEIECLAELDYLQITVQDHGTSFKIGQEQRLTQRIDSSKDVESLPEGGLGIFLIETLMDHVEITSDLGTRIVMVKKRRRGVVGNDQESFDTSPSS